VPQAVASSLGGLINIKFLRLRLRTLQSYRSSAQFQWNSCFSVWCNCLGKWCSWSEIVQLVCLRA